MRFGTSLTEPQSPQALSVLREQLKMAVDDGFSSAWMANIFGLDALTALAVAGRGIAGIEIGTAVVPTYPRHPAVLAQQALTDRAGARLAARAGHRPVAQDRHRGHVRLRLRRPGRAHERVPVDPAAAAGRRAGRHSRARRCAPGIGLSVPRTGEVPVLLAALGPQMLKLAGQRTAGTILWMTGPATVRDYIVPTISAAAQEAGRPGPAGRLHPAGLRHRRP